MSCRMKKVKLYCGEYGVIDLASPVDTIKWYQAIHAIFEKYEIGRAAWTYRGKDFGLERPELNEVRAQLIELL